MIDQKLQHAMWCAKNWDHLHGVYPECDECPYRPEDQAACDEIDAIIDAAYDALMPRMMSLREVELALDEPVWLEERDDGVTVAIVDSSRHMDAIWMTIGGRKGVVKDCSMYGRTWRCWTLRPSDEQRKSAPWKE